MPIFKEGRQDMDTVITIVVDSQEAQSFSLATQFPGNTAPYAVGHMLQANAAAVVRVLREAQIGNQIMETNGIVPAKSSFSPSD